MQNFILTKQMAWENVEFFKQNSEEDYVRCIQSIIKSKPFGDHKFYIYSFVKRIDDAAGIKKMYHQPRLTKGDPIPGTTLMRVDPNNPGEAMIIWTLPDEESMGMYQQGMIFQDKFVFECVEKYFKNPRELMKREEGDLSDEEIREVYKDVKRKLRSQKCSRNVNK